MEKQLAQNELEKFVQEKNIQTYFPNYKVFDEFLIQTKEWEEKGKELVITSVLQIEEMKQAREARLALKNIRVSIEKKRKELKEDSLKIGTAIDEVAKFLINAIIPTEKHLDEQEKFIEREELRIKEELKNKRLELLKPFAVETQFFDLSSMPEENFLTLLENSEMAFNARKEKERIALEEEQKKQALNKRILMLREFGFNHDLFKKVYFHNNGLQLGEEVVLNTPDDVFSNTLVNLNQQIKALELEEQKERERLKQIEVEKNAELKRLKIKQEAELAKQNEALKIANQAKLKAEQELKAIKDKEIADALEKQAEIEAELSKGDKEKMVLLIKDLHELSNKYQFKSKKHKKLYEEVGTLLNKITNHITLKS